MDGRDNKGRFLKGVSGNPKGSFKPGQSGNPAGRPPREREEAYLDILLAICTPEEWAEVCTKALAQAKRGNDRARDWLDKHIMPSPKQRMEISGLESGPLQVTTYNYGRAIADIAGRPEGDNPAPSED